jgi:hypothetical protein
MVYSTVAETSAEGSLMHRPSGFQMRPAPTRRTVAQSVDETYHAIEGAFDPAGVRQKADRGEFFQDLKRLER